MTGICYQSQRIDREPKNRFDYDKREVKDDPHHKSPAEVRGSVAVRVRMVIMGMMVVSHSWDSNQ
jgi:hypothetical protein